MKKLVLLSTLTLLAACGNSTTPATSSTTTTTTQSTTTVAPLQTFNFSTEAFNVKASSKWIKIEQSEKSALELMNGSAHSYIMFFTLEKNEVVTKNLEDLSKIIFPAGTKEYGITDLTYTPVKIANQNAIISEIEATESETKLKMNLSLIEFENNFIFVVTSTSADTHSKVIEEVNTILNSLQAN